MMKFPKLKIGPKVKRPGSEGRGRKPVAHEAAVSALRSSLSASKSCPSEHEEQKALILWAAAQVGRGRKELALLYAVPNGGDRKPSVAGKLKAEGVKAGVPDLHLPVPHGGAPGLFIEMKRRLGAQVRKNQFWWHEQLRARGFVVVVCRGASEAVAVIEDYLSAGGRE